MILQLPSDCLRDMSIPGSVDSVSGQVENIRHRALASRIRIRAYHGRCSFCWRQCRALRKFVRWLVECRPYYPIRRMRAQRTGRRPDCQRRFGLFGRGCVRLWPCKLGRQAERQSDHGSLLSDRIGTIGEQFWFRNMAGRESCWTLLGYLEREAPVKPLLALAPAAPKDQASCEGRNLCWGAPLGPDRSRLVILTGCGRTASAAFDANDPEQTSGVRCNRLSRLQNG
jgi:hypothetical protein